MKASDGGKGTSANNRAKSQLCVWGTIPGFAQKKMELRLQVCRRFNVQWSLAVDHERFPKTLPSPETHGFHDEVVVPICTDLHRLLVWIMVEHIRSRYHVRIV